MNNNYMEKLAEMFSLKIGEEFEIEDINSKFKFTPNGIINLTTHDYENDIIINLLTKRYNIIVPKYKPRNDDEYYWFESVDDNEVEIISSYFYNGNTLDLLNYRIGNCFRSRNEALMHKEEIKEIFDNIRKEMEWE